MEVDVPANTRRVLILPGKGGEPLEVGSGKYTWSYPYQPLQAKRKPLSLDSTIGGILDDSEAFPLVMQAIRQNGTELADSILAQEKRTLREAVAFLPWGEKFLAIVNQVLSGLGR